MKLLAIALLAVAITACEMPTEADTVTRDPNLIGRFEGNGVYYVFSASGDYENGMIDDASSTTIGEWTTSGEWLTISNPDGSMTLRYGVTALGFTLYLSDSNSFFYARQ
jgi:hypothetical protein